MKVSLALLLCFLLSPNAFGQRQDYDLHGLVTGPNGERESGVIIADRWTCQDGVFTPGSPLISSDAEGHFSGKISAFRFPVAIMAVDRNGRWSCVTLLQKSELQGKDLTLKLSPMKPVTMKVGVQELPGVYETNAMEIYAVGGPSKEDRRRPEMCFFLQFSNPKVPLRLPVGSYRLLVRTRTISYFEHPFKVSEQSRSEDLGLLTAKASTEGLLFGHQIPEWHLAATRGLPEDVKVEDFRGKWLLVEGWAYWCVPCVQEGIPELMKFWDAHKDHSDRFALIAFHTHSNMERDRVSTLADVDRLTQAAKARYWGGRDIPVPIVLDRNDETADLWGIGAIPNVMLIDPNGVLVKTDDPYAYLEAQLKK